MSDHASIAAATAAGYKYVTVQAPVLGPHGQSTAQQRSTLMKPMYGGTNQSGFEMRAVGIGANTTAADANCLSALNDQRKHRYGGSTNRSKDGIGVVHVLDAS